MNTLEQKIIRKQARIGVVGLGYVGLPLAVEFASRGFETLGIEVDAKKVAAINAGRNYIADVDDKVFARVTKSGLLKAAGDYGDVAKLDVIYICVPTPFTPNKEPDITFIVASAKRNRSAVEERAAHHSEEHDVSKHNRRVRPSHPRRVEAENGGGLLSGLLP